MRQSSRSLAGIVCGVLVLGSAAMAQDWPQWRGPNRDGKATGFNAPATWPKQLAQKWKVAVGNADATPALVGDKLYVFGRQGGDEVIICLNAADGKEIWKDKYAAAAVSGPDARHPGPRSSPAVADGKVVTLGVAGAVSCLDAASGKVLWRNEEYKAFPRFHTASSPIIVDGLAVVQLGGAGAGTTVAFDLATGNAKWKWTGEGPDYSSPVVMTVDGIKQIVTMTEKGAVGVALADGKLLWQVPFPLGRMAYNAATPIVDGQTLIIGGQGQGRGTKAFKIEKQGDGFAAKELWTNDLAPQFNTPVLKDGMLFGISGAGNLFCIDAKTGKTAWTDTAKISAQNQQFGSVVDAGPVLLAMSAAGDLIVFKADAKAFSEVARYKLADAPTYAHPIVAGNRVFVRDQESLAMWVIE